MNKEDALAALSAKCKGEISDFELVLHSKVNESCGNSRKRSLAYKDWLLLCRKGTHEDVGFLVCPYYDSTCNDPLRKYDPKKGGTNSLTLHMSKHDKNSKKHRTAELIPRNVSQGSKSFISRAAAMACYMDLLPLSWTYNHEGVERFALSVFNAGTKMMPGQLVNVKDFMPSANTVKAKVLELEAEERKKDKDFRLKQAIEVGGAMSCDGLKQKHSGAKVYDLTLHFFQERRLNSSEGKHLLLSERQKKKELELVCRTLFVSPLPPSSGESAMSIRALLSEMCMKYTSIPFSIFQQNFTFVTDCAATMPNIVGSSVSPNVAPLDHAWVGCIPHQMNTVMKTVFSKSKLISSGMQNVWENLEAMRGIVRVFKQGGWNAELPDGKALISEIETRFGLIHSMCTRFIHSCTEVYLLIEKKENASGREL